MLPWDSYRLSHVLCINHPIYLLLVSIQITLWYPQGDQCLFPKIPQTDTTREANPSKTRPNSPTLGLTNSCRTQLPSGFLQYLSVLDTEQKGKTDLLNVKVDHHRIWDSQESESEKKADGVGFQLSSWTESNLPSEPLSMNKHSKVFCFLSDQQATIPALISSLSSHSGLPLSSTRASFFASLSACLPYCTGAEVPGSVPSTGLCLLFYFSVNKISFTREQSC